MSKEKDIETTTAFYGQLFNSSKYVIAVVLIASAMQVYLVPKLEVAIAEIILICLTITKIGFIIALAFNQLMKIIGQSHILIHVLTLFGYLIALIVISFSVDYGALYLIEPSHFKYGGNPANTLSFFDMFYFSLITFSSVGYGDIVPISIIAKTLVILEVTVRFFVLVFGIANVNRIKVNK
ncbi:ion channel [Christiangramia flava]|uniref:ion channel n=1 Tax=Christiangramia flava TaxID=1486245 RepID=UPI0009FA4B03|nr:ion channel [Christiangramia flava]